jgi:hypothetical protein
VGTGPWWLAAGWGGLVGGDDGVGFVVELADDLFE